MFLNRRRTIFTVILRVNRFPGALLLVHRNESRMHRASTTGLTKSTDRVGATIDVKPLMCGGNDMTMTEWFLAELESEAAKSRRMLEQVPAGKRDWKPHERSMELGYLSDLVANIPSKGRCPGARGPAEDHRRAPRDGMAPPREWSSRARAAASPRDSRYVPALGASPWTDDGLPAPAGVEGAFSVWADCRRSEFRMK